MNIQKKIKLFFKFLDKKNYLLNSFGFQISIVLTLLITSKKKILMKKLKALKRLKISI